MKQTAVTKTPATFDDETPKLTMTVEDYLAWEPAQLERHEFLDGEVITVTGSEDGHCMVAGNVGIALRQHLSGSPCRTSKTRPSLWPVWP